MSHKPISIIGAGIAGLTLGRALQKHGIKAIIYDRKAASARHAYAITLYAPVHQRLLNLLGIDETELRREVGVLGTGRINESKLVSPVGSSTTSFKAHRGKLEDLLREGLDIQWERPVERVEWSRDEGTLLHMKTGGDLKNTLIIGADGPHSRVRSGMLPNLELTVLPYVAFNGKRRVPLKDFEQHYAPQFGNSTLLERKFKDVLLTLSIFDSTEDNISVNWIYSRPAHGASDPLHNPKRAPSGATETPQEFFDEINALGQLEQPFADMFDTSRLQKERILHWLMRTTEIECKALVGLLKDDIVLIGDAAHAEPILGGEGANNAILDALDLADVLAKSQSTEDLSSWIEDRYPKWREGIQRSKDRIAQIHDTKHSNL